MPDESGRLFVHEFAERIGISPSDLRARVSRKLAPSPDDRVVVGGAVRSVWLLATVDEYLAGRQARLANKTQIEGEAQHDPIR